MLALALLLLFPPAFAVDSDGDGVDSATDCDDGDASVYRNETGSKSYTLDTDAEVAAFCDTYCSRDVGDLTLQDITTTDGLSCLTQADDLLIDAPELADLGGLEGVTYLSSLMIPSSALVDLQGLSNVTRISRIFVGCDASAADDLSGYVSTDADFQDDELGTLTFIEEYIAACDTDGNPAMESLYGLDALSTVSDVYLGKGSLTHLSGLNGVTELEHLGIYGQNSLTGLTGLDNLATVEGELYIGESDSLASLAGLGALSEVTVLTLDGDDAITDLRGLETLTSTRYLRILGDSRLRSFQGLDSLGDGFALLVEGPALISDMDGLDGVVTLERLDLLNLPLLTSLDGLDSLTTVNADLQIMGAPRLTSLTALGALTKVGDRMALGCYRSLAGKVRCADNTSLASLSGLDALASVRTLSLARMPLLTSLSGLGAITKASRLELNATGLTNLSGLSALTSVSELNIGCFIAYDDQLSDTSYYLWRCDGNSALTSLDGLTALTTVSHLRLVGNDGLTDVSELASVSISYLDVAENGALVSLSGMGPFSGLKWLALGCWESRSYDGLHSFACPGEPLLETAPTVTSTSMYFVMLAGLPALDSLAPLGSVRSTEYLFASGELGAAALDGLDALTTVGSVLAVGCLPKYWSGSDGSGGVHCYGTSGLASLSGLEALRTVDELRIHNNRDLSDVSGLESLTRAGDLSIVSNRSLSTADAESLVDAIDTITGDTTVVGNAP